MAITVADYIESAAPEMRDGLSRLRQAIRDGIPAGFSEEMSYGMIGWVVPLSTYPSGYHCEPSLPVPFLALAAQKRYISFYHLGLYAAPALYEWFVSEYGKLGYRHKLDMGKSCIRFKYLDEIPYELIKELVGKTTLAGWLDLCEHSIKDRNATKAR